MSYKKVIAIGDSFTRGDELADCPAQLSKTKCQFSTQTWPALIAKSLNADYDCRAFGGIGNLQTSFKTIGKIKQDYLYIVNWTWFERFDYVNVVIDEWQTTHPKHEDKLDHYFYRNLDSDLWNLFRNLQQIHSTISLLKQHNTDFIMTCLDPTYSIKIKDCRPNQALFQKWDDVIIDLQEQVLPYIIEFNGMSFLDWAKHNNYQLGPNGHPLEDAHSAAAQYIQRTVPLLH